VLVKPGTKVSLKRHDPNDTGPYQSADDVAKAWTIAAKYTGYATPIPVRLLQNVQVVFDELK